MNGEARFGDRFSANWRGATGSYASISGATGCRIGILPEISVEAMLADTQAVAAAAETGKFALLGISQGCAFSIRYAVEHPEQVYCLVLLGGYLRGRLRRPMQEQKQLFEMLTTMIRDGWGSPNPVFRHFFTSTFIPDASQAAANSFDELQRIATSPESALRIWEMNAQVDVVEIAKRVSVPTLVLHCEGDRVVPPEEGHLVAKLIPGAQFVELSGNNHVLLAGTPALTGVQPRGRVPDNSVRGIVLPIYASPKWLTVPAMVSSCAPTIFSLRQIDTRRRNALRSQCLERENASR